MGINIFHAGAAEQATGRAFAVTELSLPDEVALLAEPQPSTAAAEDSQPLSSRGLDSSPLPLESQVPDVVTGFGIDSLPAANADLAVASKPTLSHIGRYALKGLLGAGGLGQVHEAWDPLLSRTVAVKTLQFSHSQTSGVSLDAMFLNEARAAAGLTHAHIVTVHDAGLSPQGVYIAMERLRGCDLRQRLAAGWQPTQGQAALLVRRVADALAYAHARGVVHCDIKPANIFLNKRDKPKVLDFGIARLTHGPAFGQAAAAQTAAGSCGLPIFGTPNYLAPEQLGSQAVDARTDIRALGVVFHELLTLQRAFDLDSVEAITTAVLDTDLAPAHELRPGVSRMLSGIAARAMARDPAARYATAQDLAHDLRRWLEKHNASEPAALESTRGPRSTEPPSRRARREARMRRHQLRTRIGITVLSLLLGAGLLLAISGGRIGTAGERGNQSFVIR